MARKDTRSPNPHHECHITIQQQVISSKKKEKEKNMKEKEKDYLAVIKKFRIHEKKNDNYCHNEYCS